MSLNALIDLFIFN